MALPMLSLILMQRYLLPLFVLCLLFLSAGCRQKTDQPLTPWGEPLATGGVTAEETDDTETLGLDAVQQAGQLIMLTISGPDTYYEYRGRGVGKEYFLCEDFAQQIGVQLRVDICRDTMELVEKLQSGEGDVVAYPLPKGLDHLTYCAGGWAVAEGNTSLADTLNRWYKPSLVNRIDREVKTVASVASVTRKVYSPMLDRQAGVISQWDALFRKYSAVCGWDWRLLAAQCYQESCFDPSAHSWAGACGLMQIMPSTADHLSLPRNLIYDPEKNVAAAARYVKELEAYFHDIPSVEERQFFVLACYNGGYHHIKDARALARKYHKNPNRWADVAMFVLRLQQSSFYNDPVVQHGYMRGSETVDYVARIHSRYADYRGVASTALPTSTSMLPSVPSSGNSEGVTPVQVSRTPSTLGPGVPQKATKKYKYDVN